MVENLSQNCLKMQSVFYELAFSQTNCRYRNNKELENQNEVRCRNNSSDTAKNKWFKLEMILEEIEILLQRLLIKPNNNFCLERLFIEMNRIKETIICMKYSAPKRYYQQFSTILKTILNINTQIEDQKINNLTYQLLIKMYQNNLTEERLNELLEYLDHSFKANKYQNNNSFFGIKLSETFIILFQIYLSKEKCDKVDNLFKEGKSIYTNQRCLFFIKSFELTNNLKQFNFYNYQRFLEFLINLMRNLDNLTFIASGYALNCMINEIIEIITQLDSSIQNVQIKILLKRIILNTILIFLKNKTFKKWINRINEKQIYNESTVFFDRICICIICHKNQENKLLWRCIICNSICHLSCLKKPFSCNFCDFKSKIYLISEIPNLKENENKNLEKLESEIVYSSIRIFNTNVKRKKEICNSNFFLINFGLAHKIIKAEDLLEFYSGSSVFGNENNLIVYEEKIVNSCEENIRNLIINHFFKTFFDSIRLFLNQLIKINLIEEFVLSMIKKFALLINHEKFESFKSFKSIISKSNIELLIDSFNNLQNQIKIKYFCLVKLKIFPSKFISVLIEWGFAKLKEGKDFSLMKKLLKHLHTKIFLNAYSELENHNRLLILLEFVDNNKMCQYILYSYKQFFLYSYKQYYSKNSLINLISQILTNKEKMKKFQVLLEKIDSKFLLEIEFFNLITPNKIDEENFEFVTTLLCFSIRSGLFKINNEFIDSFISFVFKRKFDNNIELQKKIVKIMFILSNNQISNVIKSKIAKFFEINSFPKYLPKLIFEYNYNDLIESFVTILNINLWKFQKWFNLEKASKYLNKIKMFLKKIKFMNENETINYFSLINNNMIIFEDINDLELVPKFKIIFLEIALFFFNQQSFFFLIKIVIECLDFPSSKLLNIFFSKLNQINCFEFENFLKTNNSYFDSCLFYLELIIEKIIKQKLYSTSNLDIRVKLNLFFKNIYTLLKEKTKQEINKVMIIYSCDMLDYISEGSLKFVKNNTVK